MAIEKSFLFDHSNFGKLRVCMVNKRLLVNQNDLERMWGDVSKSICNSSLKSKRTSLSVKGYPSQVYVPLDEFKMEFRRVMATTIEWQLRAGEFLNWIDDVVIPNSMETQKSSTEQIVQMENMIRNFESRMNDRIYESIVNFFRNPSSYISDGANGTSVTECIINTEARAVLEVLNGICRMMVKESDKKSVTEKRTPMLPIEGTRPRKYYDLCELRKRFNSYNEATFNAGDFSCWLIALGLIYPKKNDLWKYEKYQTVPSEWIVRVSNGSSYSLKYSDELLEVLSCEFADSEKSIEDYVNFGNDIKEMIWGI